MNHDIKQAANILQEIIKTCGEFSVYEKRIISNEYCELVFYNKEIDNWIKMLTDILGTAVKPPGTKPSKEDICLTEDYGSIYGNQTLFKKEFGGTTIIAMLWPWGDRTHTTLKLAILNFLQKGDLP